MHSAHVAVVLAILAVTPTSRARADDLHASGGLRLRREREQRAQFDRFALELSARPAPGLAGSVAPMATKLGREVAKAGKVFGRDQGIEQVAERWPRRRYWLPGTPLDKVRRLVMAQSGRVTRALGLRGTWVDQGRQALFASRAPRIGDQIRFSERLSGSLRGSGAALALALALAPEARELLVAWSTGQLTAPYAIRSLTRVGGSVLGVGVGMLLGGPVGSFFGAVVIAPLINIAMDELGERLVSWWRGTWDERQAREIESFVHARYGL